MKKLLFLIAILTTAHVWGQNTIDSKKILGQWVVTWSYFSSTQTPKSEGSAPLMEAIWAFYPDGTYSIRAGMNETGKYTIKGHIMSFDSDLTLTPDFDKRDYEIVTLNDDTLEIGTEITRSADFFMVSYSVFKRKK